VPQHRERLFILGRRFNAGGGEFKFPRPTHGPDAHPPSPFYAAGKAVEGVESEDDTGLKVGGRWKSLLAEIPPGLNYSYYTSEMGHPKPVFAWRSKFSDFLYKADPEVPVRTIKAQGGAFTGPLSWKNRHFSATEMKRLQTFPDDYRIVGNRGNQVHQIGNSVPPQLGRILAMAVLDQLFAVPLPAKLHYLDDDDILGFRKRKRALTNRYRLAAATAIEALSPANDETMSSSIAGGSDKFSLGSQFALSFPPKIGEPTYKSNYHINNSNLLVTLDRDRCKNSSFTIKLYPNKNGWNIPIDSVKIESSYQELKDVTAAWKYFEFLVRKLYRVDDLVQLNGYYQYDSKLRAEIIEFTPDNLGMMKILSSICDGHGVAYQTNLNDLAHSWSISKNDALLALHALKNIGFEVRNRSTNNQMAEDEYLIPYRFPTLNPRSVQLFKNL
jgi:DNA (cytosine-5)-methyltransferase 1